MKNQLCIFLFLVSIVFSTTILTCNKSSKSQDRQEEISLDDQIDTLELSNFIDTLNQLQSELNFSEIKKRSHLVLKSLDEENETYKIYISKILKTLSISYANQGGLDSAISLSEKSLHLLKDVQPENHIDQAKMHQNIGVFYNILGKYEQALFNYQKSVDLKSTSLNENHIDWAPTYMAMAKMENTIQNTTNAKKMFYKAKNVLEINELRSSHLYAYCLSELATIESKEGNYEHALDLNSEALRIELNQTEEEAGRISNIYNQFGLIYEKAQAYPEAISYFRKCIRTEEKSKVQIASSYAIIFQNIAGAYENLYSYNQAENYYDSAFLALNIPKDTLIDFEEIDFPLETLNLLVGKARFYHKKYELNNHKNDLLASYNLFQNIHQYLDFLRAQIFLPGTTQIVQNNYYPTVESIIAMELILKDLQPHKDYDVKAFKASENFKFYLLLKEIKDNKGQNMVTLNKVKSPSFIQDSLLKHNQALIEYFVGDSSIFVFTITKDTFHTISINKDFPLEMWVEDMRKSIVNNHEFRHRENTESNKTYANAAFQIYQKIFHPITSLLPEDTDLIIIPDGVLNYIPFEALITSKVENLNDFSSYDYLLKKNSISYSYSATLLNEFKNKKSINSPENPLLAMAPFYDGDTTRLASIFPYSRSVRKELSPLRFSGDEINHIIEITGGKKLYGKTATKEAFLENAGNYKILHLATHAQANDNSGDYSFLVFAETGDSIDNGLLYVSDLYNMNINPEMVVLSACETGLGELQRGEGVIGLTRGFAYAGAKSIVSTLWTVPDKSSSILMTKFYEYIEGGYTKDQALRKAKLDLIKNQYPEPYYWAAYIPIGNMEAIPLKSNLFYNSSLFYILIAVVLSMALLLAIYLRKKKETK